MQGGGPDHSALAAHVQRRGMVWHCFDPTGLLYGPIRSRLQTALSTSQMYCTGTITCYVRSQHCSLEASWPPPPPALVTFARLPGTCLC